MKFVLRHLLSILLVVLLPVAVFGWWHSSRVWSAVDVETPVGIMQLKSESSQCGFVIKLMRHDHRWAIFSTPDTITGESMEFVARFPRLQIGRGNDIGLFLILPYWQLVLLLAVLAGVVFWGECKWYQWRQQRLIN